MSDAAALQKLLTWLSPAFPVGTFAWSSGLETAIAEKAVTDPTALQDWIGGSLAHGGIRTDAILLAHAHRAVDTPLPSSPTKGEVPLSNTGAIEQSEPDHTLPTRVALARSRAQALVGRDGEGLIGATLADLADLCLALTPARERHLEIETTGDAFTIAARAWPSPVYASLPRPCPYPIAVGAVAAAHGIGLGETLLAYLTATVHAQISVAIRLVPLGQTDGLRVMAALEPEITALATAASTATLADLGSIAYAADIAQMRHETREPRIFRS